MQSDVEIIDQEPRQLPQGMLDCVTKVLSGIGVNSSPDEAMNLIASEMGADSVASPPVVDILDIFIEDLMEVKASRKLTSRHNLE